MSAALQFNSPTVPTIRERVRAHYEALRADARELAGVIRVAGAIALSRRLPDLQGVVTSLHRAAAGGVFSPVEAEALEQAAHHRGEEIRAAHLVAKVRRPIPVARRERRRLLAACPMPPAIAALFTECERAALKIVSDEKRAGRDCDLAHWQIAARAGVSVSSVRNALRRAAQAGLVLVRHRPGRRRQVSLSNVTTIVDPGWLAWLRYRPRDRPQSRGGGGVKDFTASGNKSLGEGREAIWVAPTWPPTAIGPTLRPPTTLSANQPNRRNP